MKVFSLMLLVALLMLPVVSLSQAQQASDPLLDRLRFVPDDENARAGFSYVNYQAISEVWDLPPVTHADFENDTEVARAWLRSRSYVVVGPEMTALRMCIVADLPDLATCQELVGFSWFQVEQAVMFGVPPYQGKVLSGDFDTASLNAAFENRPFIASEIGGYPAWCSDAGCETGTQQYLRETEPGNPFGGQLGRREPLVILPGYLVNSPDLATVESILAAAGETTPRLFESPEYRVLVDTLSEYETLLQFVTLPTANLRDTATAEVGPFTSDVAHVEDAIAQFGTLPPYVNIAMADTVQGNDHLALIMLVYEDAAVAEAGAAELAHRLSVAVPLQREDGTPYLEHLAEHGFEVDLSTSVYEGDTHAVVVITLRTPFQADPASGLMFRALWTDIYLQRGGYFLSSLISQPQ